MDWNELRDTLRGIDWHEVVRLALLASSIEAWIDANCLGEEDDG
jgi:hypothetical protein